MKRIGKKEIIVVLSHHSWNFPCDYVKQTSLELSKKAKVIIFSPLDFPTIRQLIFRGENDLFSKNEEIVRFPSLGYFPFQRIAFIRKLNIGLNFFFFRLFYLLNFGRQKPIFWIFFHRLVLVKDYFSWGKFLIYDRVDQAGSLDPNENKVKKLEDRQLLQAADYVFVNSSYALRYVKRYNKKSFLVPCGSAVDLFLGRGTSQPREMKKIKKPILGLIGSIDHRLDFNLIYSLAKKRKEWSFVFIGIPFSQQVGQFKIANLEQWLRKLGKLPNVYFLGQKPKKQLADFIASFDICLIPYDTSQEFVKGCNPMKLYEYLAMGKSVVSTPIGAVEEYSSTVETAQGLSDSEKAVEVSLKKGADRKKVEKRKKIAMENSWSEKVEKMWRIVVKGFS